MLALRQASERFLISHLCTATRSSALYHFSRPRRILAVRVTCVVTCQMSHVTVIHGHQPTTQVYNASMPPSYRALTAASISFSFTSCYRSKHTVSSLIKIAESFGTNSLGILSTILPSESRITLLLFAGISTADYAWDP
jgi:hypothetical protein